MLSAWFTQQDFAPFDVFGLFPAQLLACEDASRSSLYLAFWDLPFVLVPPGGPSASFPRFLHSTTSNNVARLLLHQAQLLSKNALFAAVETFVIQCNRAKRPALGRGTCLGHMVVGQCQKSKWYPRIIPRLSHRHVGKAGGSQRTHFKNVIGSRGDSSFHGFP